MSGDSTQLDPIFWSEKSLEFEFAPRSKVIGKGEAIHALVEKRLGSFK